ncbi:MAG TPA: sugar-binding protein [Mycobacteriales bacterium]
MSLIAAVAVVLGLSGTALATPPHPTRAPAHPARPGHVDVLFIGAHPDDEGGDLGTFGQWNEYHHASTGVVTITRGEGGGNAAGPQEGPALGLLREGEERRAVGMAGIHDIDYLDKVDFFYTVSAPLTRSIWGEQDALSRIVRLVRETTPRVIVTMNPAPVPGQHGNHQEAGRLATQAYTAAADPKAFPSQLTGEHLAPWRVDRLFEQGADGTGPTGPKCSTDFTPTDPTQDVYGVWQGTYSRTHKKTWAAVDIDALHEYVSQGFGVIPPAPTDPTKIECNYYTQIASRVPYTVGNRAGDAMLEGATTPAHGGLPLGTDFFLTTSGYRVTQGAGFTVTAHAQAAAGHALRRARATLQAPAGWKVTGTGRLGTVGPRHERTAVFHVQPAPAAKVNTRFRVAATLHAGTATGHTDRAVSIDPAVRATPQLLPQVSDFNTWATTAGVPQLQGGIKRVLSMGSGGSRSVPVTVTNDGTTAQSGTVTLKLPTGFTADATHRSYGPLAPGKSQQVPFTVTNSDASLPTADQGPDNGDYDYTITTTNSGGSADVETAGLELVPVTTIPHAATAPTVDGKDGSGEYAGPSLDTSRRWEGDDCASAADCSATTKTTWNGTDLYVLVHVRDNILGTKLDATDCKRHWRTDSVEINVDPRGNSENTATTFKTGILPITNDPKNGNPSCFERDADNHQGPGATTAPGMQVASQVTSPYTGYTVEAKIPFADLPSAVDPTHMGLNVLVYDSDTQDKTGKSRIAWSPFGGVQGDPYRWGIASLPGYTPPPGTPTTPKDPVIPQTAALSIDSPQSILQAATVGLPLAGDMVAPRSDRAWIVGRAHRRGDVVTAKVRATGPGTAHLFVWDPANATLGSATVAIAHAGSQTVRLPATTGKLTTRSTVLLGFAAKAGGSSSSSATVH